MVKCCFLLRRSRRGGITFLRPSLWRLGDLLGNPETSSVGIDRSRVGERNFHSKAKEWPELRIASGTNVLAAGVRGGPNLIEQLVGSVT